MSQEQPLQSRAVADRQQIRIRFDQLKRSSGLRVIGVPELIGLSVAALLALLTIFAYLYFLAPAHSRRDLAQLERDRLQGQVRASQMGIKEDETARATVDKINASLNDFEGNWLAAPGSGRLSLYAELNELIRSNGLRNTSGPSYTTLEPLGTKGQVQPTVSAEQQSNAKWQSVYPGISVSVTVEGPYQSVRHFVRDIEMSRQFLIINAVELEGVTQSGATTQETSIVRTPTPARGSKTAVPPGVAQPAGSRVTLVSLRLDLATYFRRAGSEKPVVP
ncbi:MAG TPA: GspMb/PilO family protein [Pyrinomonadaceae bacterium]|nr:GspMb/PilO family protein [Pyrinomonadaceae bacterium]